jgi:hypothetical protein
MTPEQEARAARDHDLLVALAGLFINIQESASPQAVQVQLNAIQAGIKTIPAATGGGLSAADSAKLDSIGAGVTGIQSSLKAGLKG